MAGIETGTHALLLNEVTAKFATLPEVAAVAGSSTGNIWIKRPAMYPFFSISISALRLKMLFVVTSGETNHLAASCGLGPYKIIS